MIEDDEEQMKEELKEAFRIYDKENQGFITNDILKVNINVSLLQPFYLAGDRILKEINDHIISDV